VAAPRRRPESVGYDSLASTTTRSEDAEPVLTKESDMVRLGYALSCEEHRPRELVKFAQQAEAAGFTFAQISDHFHPWIDKQGQSPFVWSVIGGIAQATERLRLGTGVTCPIMRYHPAIVAQAAATCASMMPGRFFLGVGTGVALNEHIVGERWPSADERRDMLAEAIELMRELWEGCSTSFTGDYFQVVDARIYTLPDDPIELLVAASGPEAATLAGHAGDGLVATAPDQEIVEAFTAAGGSEKPRHGQVTCCWAADVEEAKKMALELWPNAAVRGELVQELPLPRHFEQAATMVSEEDIAQAIVCGPDPELYLEQIQQFVDAGFDHVYLHQVGPDQQGFFDFCKREILTKC
jgi:G6PDH family F420-dependent oxidoreductase